LSKIFILTFLLFHSYGLSAHSLIDPSQAHTDLTTCTYLFEDPSGQLSFEDIQNRRDQFIEAPETGLNYGHSQSVFWFHWFLEQPNLEVAHRILQFGFPFLDHLELYHVSPDGQMEVWKTGDQLDFSTRPIKAPDFQFPIDLDQGKHELFLKVWSKGTLQISASLWTPSGLLEHQGLHRLLWGVYYGIMLVLFFYNLFVGNALKDRVYYLYALYGLFMLLTLSILFGDASWWFFAHQPWLNNFMLSFSASLTFLFVLLFVKAFLRIGPELVWQDRLFNGLIVISGLFCLLVISQLSDKVMILSVYLMLVLPIALFVVSISRLIQGDRQVRFFCAAWAVMLLATFYSGLSFLGMFKSEFLAEHALQVGSGIEMLLLSFALADRINFLRREREKSRQLLAKAVQREHKLLSDQANELEQEVQIRTEKLALANMRLSDLVRDRVEFTSIVAHDLRSPLSGIAGMAELLIMEESEPEKRQYAEGIFKSTVNMMQLIKNLLEVSNIELEQASELQNCDLGHYLSRLLPEHMRRAESKGIKLQLWGLKEGNNIWGTAMGIEAVLDNLISNAIKYTPPNSLVKILIEETPDKYVFSVKDQGGGLNEDDQKKMFGRFQKLSARPTGGESSSGLGLYIVKNMCARMGAEIVCQSQLEVGTTFFVYFQKFIEGAKPTVQPATQRLETTR